MKSLTPCTSDDLAFGSMLSSDVRLEDDIYRRQILISMIETVKNSIVMKDKATCQTEKSAAII